MTDTIRNPKHLVFAQAYLQSGNASAAAREAGYSEKTAGISGHKLLKRADVAAFLANAVAKQAESVDDLQTRVSKELEAMAFANIADFIRIDEQGLPQVDFSGATPEQLRAITSVASKRRVTTDKEGRVTEEQESKFGMADKYRGLELLGKTLGMFKADEQKVVVDVADRLLQARQRLRTIDAQSRND